MSNIPHADNCGFALYGPPALCTCGAAPTPAGEAMDAARRRQRIIEDCTESLVAQIQSARLAGYAEGVEAAAKIADKYSNAGIDGFVTAGMIAREARSLTPPAGG